ncbi:phage minor capsid protein [Terrabacter carboxydivorans]|uniref:Phage minor capsid protein 2 n=1 Tax=Terrabacter carboxydivorans TaxID=619730 RepID=A0ABN3MK46_9MICO
MPASPENGAQMAPRVLVAINDAELAILRLVAMHLRDGRGQPDWRQARLAEGQMLRARIARMITYLAGAVASEVNSIVLDAYNRGQALAMADLDLFLVPVLIADDAVDTSAVIAQSTVDTIVQAMKLIPDMVIATLREAVAAGRDSNVAGDVAALQRSQKILERLASRGFAGFSYGPECDWSLEEYAEMAVSAGAGRAAVQGHVDALAASGMDLVLVSVSPEACQICCPFERQVLSISGRVGRVLEPNGDEVSASVTDVKASLAGAIAKGLFHAGCRHELSAYLPGVTRTDVVLSTQRRPRPEQREHDVERKVRQWKRREAVALDALTRRRAAEEVRMWRMESHRAHNELTRPEGKWRPRSPG